MWNKGYHQTTFSKKASRTEKSQNTASILYFFVFSIMENQWTLTHLSNSSTIQQVLKEGIQNILQEHFTHTSLDRNVLFEKW